MWFCPFEVKEPGDSSSDFYAVIDEDGILEIGQTPHSRVIEWADKYFREFSDADIALLNPSGTAPLAIEITWTDESFENSHIVISDEESTKKVAGDLRRLYRRSLKSPDLRPKTADEMRNAESEYAQYYEHECYGAFSYTTKRHSLDNDEVEPESEHLDWDESSWPYDEE